MLETLGPDVARDMNMRVDKPGQNQLVARIDLLPAGDLLVGDDRLDDAISDREIGAAFSPSADEGSATDDEIKHQSRTSFSNTGVGVIPPLQRRASRAGICQ